MALSRRGSLAGASSSSSSINVNNKTSSQPLPQSQRSPQTYEEWITIGNSRDGYHYVREWNGWLEVRYSDDGLSGAVLSRYITSGQSQAVTRYWSDQDRNGVIAYLDDHDRRARQDDIAGDRSSIWRHQCVEITSGVHRLVTARLTNSVIAMDVISTPLRYTLAIWSTPVKLAYHILTCNRRALVNDMSMTSARNAVLLERVMVAGTRHIAVGQHYSVTSIPSTLVAANPTLARSNSNSNLPSSGHVSGTSTPISRPSVPSHHHQRSMSNINISTSSSSSSSLMSLRHHQVSSLTPHRSTSGNMNMSSSSNSISSASIPASPMPSSLLSYASLRSHSLSPSSSSTDGNGNANGRNGRTTTAHRSRDSYGSLSSLSLASTSNDWSSEAEL
jgi:hypothetical protein